MSVELLKLLRFSSITCRHKITYSSEHQQIWK